MPRPLPEDLVVAVLLAIAVITDTRSRRIPNVLTFGGMAVGLAVRSLQGDAPSALLGLALAFAIGFVLWRLGGAIRAGDAKLLMAIGAIYGPGEIFRIFLFTFLINIPVAIVQLAVSGRLKTFFRVLKSGILQEPDGPRPLMAPFAAVIAAGVVAARVFPGAFVFW